MVYTRPPMSAKSPKLAEAARCPLLERDPAGWLRCCTRRFLPVARRIAGEDELAHDALHEAWIIVLQRLNQYRGGSPACGWVRAIVRHEAIHSIAAQARETPLAGTEPAAGRSPEIKAYEAELRVLLLAAIDELPPTYREVVRLRDIEERSTAEAAAQLHISKRNAAVRLHRAHRLLRARLLARR